MKVFIAALDEGGLRKAGRKLGRSPAAISRALAFLEAHVGVTLLHRTTRSFKLSEAGERYAIVCRRVISDLEEADLVAAGERSAPRGTLTITAPVAAGEDDSHERATDSAGGGSPGTRSAVMGRRPPRLFRHPNRRIRILALGATPARWTEPAAGPPGPQPT